MAAGHLANLQAIKTALDPLTLPSATNRKSSRTGFELVPWAQCDAHAAKALSASNGRSYSIAAALRMQTIVAEAGSCDMLRIVCGWSQRYLSVSPALARSVAPPTSTSSSPAPTDKLSTEPR